MPRHISEPIGGSVELINIAPSEHSPLISKCTIKVCYVQDTENRNGSIITKETARKMAPTLRGAIIAGYFNEKSEDYEEHNERFSGYKDGKAIFSSNTRPYGFVDIGAKVWFQKFVDDLKDERLYLCTEGWLWTSAYPETKKILEEGRGQSMELDKDSLDASWSNNNNGGPQFFIINEAVVEKLTILGEDFEPCFEGASITGEQTQFSLNNDFKERVFSMLTELKQLLEEGGETSMEQKSTPETVEEVILPAEEITKEEVVIDNYKKKEEETKQEEKEEETSGNEEKEESSDEAEEKETEDEEEDKKKKKDYALEYATLEERYNNLVNDYAALETANKNLESELADLREFKAKIDKQKKQDMIDSFSMLSEEDKKDVIDNIDTYSLDDIEAKLSVICVRNKVIFTAEEPENDVTTYNLDENTPAEPEIPAWIRAINEVVAERK